MPVFNVRYLTILSRPLNSTVSEDAGIEPSTVATLALTAKRSNLSDRPYPPFIVIKFLARITTSTNMFNLYTEVVTVPTYTLFILSMTRTFTIGNASVRSFIYSLCSLHS